MVVVVVVVDTNNDKVEEYRVQAFAGGWLILYREGWVGGWVGGFVWFSPDFVESAGPPPPGGRCQLWQVGWVGGWGAQLGRMPTLFMG